MVIMVKCGANLSCFAISDIYIYTFEEFMDGEGVNDCLYIFHFVIVKLKNVYI